MHSNKILFLVKENNEYGSYSFLKSGLINSVRFLVSSLVKHDIVEHAKLVVCRDGNQIDKEIYEYRPKICIIEALWATPKKLAEVQRLHTKVKFIVRVHSNIPFLAMEGNSIDWILQYESIPNVFVSFNNYKTTLHFRILLHRPVYLPNVYEEREHEHYKAPGHQINIGCFGAIRPLKNQLIQAVAAIAYADMEGKKLHFHINSPRVEQQGENILKNIRALFKDSDHQLKEHGWLSHPNFLNVVKSMHVGLQVSYTESFNIVAADFVSCGIPIVVSSDIDWIYKECIVGSNDLFAMVEKIKEMLEHSGRFIIKSKKALMKYNQESLFAWRQTLTALH